VWGENIVWGFSARMNGSGVDNAGDPPLVSPADVTLVVNTPRRSR
jgi:hypothetical protein